MDTFSKNERSRIMCKVKGKETKLEIAFRSLLWKQGIKYRKNNFKYFGKPDLMIRGKKLVIFIDSCFWHGCKKHLRMPGANQSYWLEKIKKNKNRDRKVNKYYKDKKWMIFRVWEHNIKNEVNVLKEVQNIVSSLKWN